MTYSEARDAAADKYAAELAPKGLTCPIKLFAFQAGANWGAFESPVVLELVNALKVAVMGKHVYGKFEVCTEALANWEKAKGEL